MAFGTLDEFMAYIARPGAVWMTSGERGGGKTHTAVATIEKMVKGEYPHVRRTIVATNVIFYHKVDGELRVEPPPGVHHIRTMRDFFPIVVDSIRRYGRDVLIMLLLDEAQGFIGGDLNSTNASIPMKEFLGTIRKYNVMVWYLTPSAKQLGPAFRNLINGNPSGNVTCRWQKDLSLNEKWIEANHLRCSPKSLMLVRPYDADPAFISIPVTEWTGTVDKLKNGQYCYDHEASATFREGEGFSFNDFNDHMGGVASIHAMDAIEEFYRTRIRSEGGVPAKPVRTEEDIERESKAKLYSRLQQNGMNQRDAAEMIGVPRSTLNLWCRELGLSTGKGAVPALSELRSDDGTSTHEIARIDDRNPERTSGIGGGNRCPNPRAASGMDNGQKGGSKSPIYISSEERRRSPPAEIRHVRDSDGSGRGSDDRMSSDHGDGTAIPDGRYSLPEFRRAVEHCTRGEEE